MIIVSVITCNQCVDLPKVHRERNFPLGFRCAKMGLAYFDKGKTVIIPYLCMRVSSTIKSSFSWIGMGKLWLYTALSSFGVSLTLNSVFIPISILCLPSISWYSTKIFSTVYFSVSVSSVSVQSNRFRNFIRGSTSSFEFSFSFSCSSRSSSCLYWSVVLGSAARIFCCWKEGITLLFWFICSEYFV